MRFFCVTQAWLDATNEVLRKASDDRSVEFVAITPDDFMPDSRLAPRPGDLLYRAAAGNVPDRIEKLLWRRGVAAFYADPFFECLEQSIWLERSGIPTPRMFHTLPKDREKLAALAKRLGGFPVVLKVPGGEGGQGVIRVDSLPALFSLVDHVSPNAVMMEYFEHVVAYRLIVLGDEIIATEARHSGPFDFRTNAAGANNLGKVRAPARAARMALAAAKALKLEFGGADVLEDKQGRMILAELNFPCYFADQERDSGIPIADRMIDFLIAKSRRLNRARERRAR